MQLTRIKPHPEIAPFIDRFWVFRSPIGLPSGDARVVPNGRQKLVVPWRNGRATDKAKWWAFGVTLAVAGAAY